MDTSLCLHYGSLRADDHWDILNIQFTKPFLYDVPDRIHQLDPWEVAPDDDAKRHVFERV